MPWIAVWDMKIPSEVYVRYQFYPFVSLFRIFFCPVGFMTLMTIFILRLTYLHFWKSILNEINKLSSALLDTFTKRLDCVLDPVNVYWSQLNCNRKKKNTDKKPNCVHMEDGFWKKATLSYVCLELSMSKFTFYLKISK